METNIKSGSYKHYISGLKGFSCLMVMIGHYIGLYKYAENFPVKSTLLDFLGEFLDSKIGFVLDESYWVILFFVVSGYLVANSKIPTIKTFFMKSFMRFLRLGLPVLFAFAVIFVIYKTVGFHTTDTTGIFENPFIQGSLSGRYDFLDVILSPIKVILLGDYLLNNPYWCLREMFFTSILIYFLLWLKEKIKNKNLFFLIFFIALIIGLVNFNVMFAGLLGMMVALLEKEENKYFYKNKVFVFFLLILCAVMRIAPRSRISCVFFAALILLVPKLPILNNIFSSKIAQFFSKISFGIYSFHWPVLCSIGMLVLINTYKQIGLGTACIAACGICIVISLLISVIYYYCIEKHIYSALKKRDRKNIYE